MIKVAALSIVTNILHALVELMMLHLLGNPDYR